MVMAKSPASGPWDSIKKMAKKRPRNTKESRVKAIIGFLILRSLAKAMVTMVGTAIQPTIKNNPKSNLASPYAMPEMTVSTITVKTMRIINASLFDSCSMLSKAVNNNSISAYHGGVSED